MTNKYMYFVANWKMFGNLKSINTLDKVIKFSKSKEIKKGRLIYCPPYTLISLFFKKFEKCLIDIGAQNCHESDNYGSHTGFINSRMLKSVGAKYVIIGHSDNRAEGDTDLMLKDKVKLALKNKKIHGYGASTKGNVLLQYFNINTSKFKCIVSQ